MRLALTSRGRWFVFSSGVLLLAGAASGLVALATLGMVAVSTLIFLYALHAPRAAEILRGGLRLAWSLERDLSAKPGQPRPAADVAEPTSPLSLDEEPREGAEHHLRRDAPTIAGRPLALEATLKCHTRTRLGSAKLVPVAHPALEITGAMHATLEPKCEARLRARVLPHTAGSFVIHGAALELTDPFGLFVANAYFPNPLWVTALPRAYAGATAALAGLLTMAEASGRPTKKRGVGGELREIREHVHGDPWKSIAWGATARTGKLMVREFELDASTTFHILVDATAPMRQGPAGSTGLDIAIEGATAVARAALEQGDRVALTVAGLPRLPQIQPARGPAHVQRVVRTLLDARPICDADVTQVTSGELAEAVARYVRHQEGIDTEIHRAPGPDDPAWERVVTGPSGRLYDMRALARTCAALAGLDRSGSRSSSDEEVVRMLCALRGIDLPPREITPVEHATILAEALAVAALPRTSRMLLVFTNFGATFDTGAAVAALQRWKKPIAVIKRRRHRLTLFFPRGSIVPADGPNGAVAARSAERRGEQAVRAIERLGVQVVPAFPSDSHMLWLRRIGRAAGPGTSSRAS